MPGWWQQLIQALQQEFSDLAGIGQVVQLGLRLVLAGLLGGLLGYERQRAGKAAGVRTQMLVAMGTALFVVVPMQAGMEPGDLSRVLQGLVAGIGFLGAGVILKADEEMRVHGLTTAASVWMTAAIGMTVGMGRGVSAILATLLALLVLAVLPRFGNHKRD
jgi:putative Mg2+ transporter-C (MgtC) family protein